MLSTWTGSSARISAGLSASHLPEATAGALLSLQPTLYSQALPAQGSCSKLCLSQFSFPLRTINCYLSSCGSLTPMYHEKLGAVSLYFSLFGLIIVACYPVKFWNLANIKGRKFEVLPLSSFVTPVPCRCLSVSQQHILSPAASGIDRKPLGRSSRPPLTFESILSYTPSGPYYLADLWCLTCFISVINPTFLNVLSGSFALMLSTPSH